MVLFHVWVYPTNNTACTLYPDGAMVDKRGVNSLGHFILSSIKQVILIERLLLSLYHESVDILSFCLFSDSSIMFCAEVTGLCIHTIRLVLARSHSTRC